MVAGAVALLALSGCSSEVSNYHHAITGEPCVPNDTLVPGNGNGNGNGNGGHNSPTGIPGDNIDDPHSGQVDCLYDGNSGQGDDKKHGCVPPPGCDDQGCCEEPPPPSDDPPSDDPPSDDPPSDDPPSDDPPACPAADVCMVSADCGSTERVCTNGCCQAAIE